MDKFSFSGHETFACKQYWLKKGYDFVKKEKSFRDPHAVIDLGVGKNMVASIRFWMKAFGLTNDEDHLNEMAEYLFGENGKDVFLEDLGTLWLLHYQIVKTKKASIYSLVFNQLRRERMSFTREQLMSFLERKCEETGSMFNEKTVTNDVKVFLNNYTKNSSKTKVDVEEDFSKLLLDLRLIRHFQDTSEDKLLDVYEINYNAQEDLPAEIFLFSILDNYNYSSSISFKELTVENDSPGIVFSINRDGIADKIEQLTEMYSGITFSQTAGNQVLQFKTKPDKWEVLNNYYDSRN
ncbi:MAG: DUF4007 family protein [Bacteroidota bacterium]